MPNIELLEKSMPVAPIRIAALEGCRELAEEVDRNLVKFRKELVEKKGALTISHRDTAKTLYRGVRIVRVSVPVKVRESLRNLSEELIFTYGRCYQLQFHIHCLRSRESHVSG